MLLLLLEEEVPGGFSVVEGREGAGCRFVGTLCRGSRGGWDRGCGEGLGWGEGLFRFWWCPRTSPLFFSGGGDGGTFFFLGGVWGWIGWLSEAALHVITNASAFLRLLVRETEDCSRTNH